MKRYNRLTTTQVVNGRNIKTITSKGKVTIQDLIDRLYELEDKIESGTLVELPCKVGDTVYCLIAQGRFGTVYTTGEAVARVVSKIIWDGKRFEIYSERPHYWENGYNECNFYGYWGDSVFATKAEVENILEKMKNE